MQFLVLLVASWLQRRQAEGIESLRAENRVLRDRLGPSRLRFTDAERKLLAERGRQLGRRALAYHQERNHQGIGNVIPMLRVRAPAVGAVRCRERLGGVLQFYEREAA
jgi:hypothetical protein